MHAELFDCVCVCAVCIRGGLVAYYIGGFRQAVRKAMLWVDWMRMTTILRCPGTHKKCGVVIFSLVLSCFLLLRFFYLFQTRFVWSSAVAAHMCRLQQPNVYIYTNTHVRMQGICGACACIARGGFCGRRARDQGSWNRRNGGRECI